MKLLVFVVICLMIELVADSPGVGVTIGLSETGHAVVFTLVDSASQELQQQAAASSLLPVIENETSDGLTGPVTVPLPSQSDASNESEVYIVRAEPKQLDVPTQLPPEQIKEEVPAKIESETIKQQDVTIQDEVTTQTTSTLLTPSQEQANDSSVVTQESQPDHEDIPSFSEWAQKQLAEAEKKKGENKTGHAKRGLKLRSKNYASPDCGAKVVNTNPEAGSAWAVLSPSRDEYLLNSCNNKIWFIVELCEAIQPKKIELANFELFSSILREFSVSVSDRHPTRDWTLLGQFEGKEVRTVQSFNLDPPSAFVKYIKVEFHSHYGSEHYCPISLFRVYGTSEFEVLDTVDEAHTATVSVDEDEDDEFDEGENLEKPRNLFTSARDAVLSIVKRAAEVLVKREDELEDGSGQLNTTELLSPLCSTPAYIIVCDNCSDDHFNRVHEILSCQGKQLEILMESKFIRNAVSNSDVCASLGLDLRTSSSGAPYPLRPRSSYITQNEPSRYLGAIFSVETISALCNVLAITQRRVVLNITYESSVDSNETVSVGQTDIPVILADPPSTCSLDSTIPSSVPYEAPSLNPDSEAGEMFASNSQIKPTKTLTTEEQLSIPIVAQSSSQTNVTDLNQLNSTVENITSNAATSQTAKSVNEEVTSGESTTASSAEDVGLEQLSEDTATGGDAISFDSLFSELDEADTDPSSSSQPATLSPPQLLQRESVLVRLAKRIKALERNMSLSGQYLEELSRRYKRQVEEMQRSLTDVIEERKKGEEKEERRSQQILQLTEQVTTLTLAVQVLTEERDSWMVKHWIVIIVEVALCALVVFVCQWLPEVEVTRNKISMAWPKAGSRSYKVERRKSVDDALGNAVPRTRKRRPSEEALRISGSTHQELLIQDPSRKNSRAENRRRRRKKKEQYSAAAATSTPATSLDSGETVKLVNSLKLQSNRKSDENINQGRKEESASAAPPPPPLPPPNFSIMNSKPISCSGPSNSVNMNGNSRILTLPTPPNYVRTALSFRKQRTSSNNSSSELTDVKDKSSVTTVKKSIPFKKIVKKFF
ncbi:uncharacterized protein LOC142320575 isoform X2 [Lycorma delicatula]|uniref:uncharacterized protein LOC142320575 isoform X2 n=1 Tax=Lycorma delicatula TaxID=130591 RepID=UPI003F517770